MEDTSRNKLMIWVYIAKQSTQLNPTIICPQRLSLLCFVHTTTLSTHGWIHNSSEAPTLLEKMQRRKRFNR
ncbi:hypothetical protein CARUB_v10015039mg [Capsella rubella]|uniref:Uncharacterized protein n=1 Tax=Capsella rubella TaxID=81985 RepID=R0G8G7_9BRAS|nr:hypothetical protein CARUB_v10015039mg [Capsella rubella]